MRFSWRAVRCIFVLVNLVSAWVIYDSMRIHFSLGELDAFSEPPGGADEPPGGAVAPQPLSPAAAPVPLQPPARPPAAAAGAPALPPAAAGPAPGREPEAATRCSPPPPIVSLSEAPADVKEVKRSLEEHVMQKTFAWCHDGHDKNGQFGFAQEGRTEGDFTNWNLKRWRPSGESEITIDDGHGDNTHRLVFNCDRTGFFVAESRQRGYIEDERGFHSPDGAGAPVDASVPDCRQATQPWTSDGRLPVWVWWDFQGSIPPTFRMNLRTWRRRIPADKFALNLVNGSNIRRFLPGVPEAFFRLYQAAKSDFLRAALLAVHGGVYMDGDMLLSHDLDVVVKDVLDGRVDVLPYEGPGDHCPKSYTTNFMAAVKGNRLSSEWIGTTLRAMSKRCNLDESENHREPIKVCCYNQDWCPRKECHVAWGDVSRPPALASLPAASVRLDCIRHAVGFAYTMTGQELFWKLTDGPNVLDDKEKLCWRVGGADLECSDPVGKLPGYLERHGHHLYNMLNGFAMEGKSEEEILASNTVIGKLYRKTLRLR